MDRKTFLKLTAGTTIGWTAWLAACREPDGLDLPEGQRVLPAIGLQLYTIRQMMSGDMRGALQATAEVGYGEVEFAGYHNHTPAQVRALLDEFGLDPVSSHVAIEDFRSDPDGVFSAAETVGHRYLVVPWLAEDQRTGDGYSRFAEELNSIGEQCRSAGFTLGYHNHAFEFDVVDQTRGRGLNILLDETDPDLVVFEMDIYWAVYGGVEPPAYFRRWPGRFPLCHVKDMGLNREMVDVGQGNMQWGNIFDDAKTGGVEHFFVEHDTPSDWRTTIQRSHDYLAALTF